MDTHTNHGAAIPLPRLHTPVVKLAQKIGWIPVYEQDDLRAWRMEHNPQAYTEPQSTPSLSVNGGTIIDRWCKRCDVSMSHPHHPLCPNREPELALMEGRLP